MPVKLGAKLTEVGTLEIWADSKESEHRWRLQFELRKAAAGELRAHAAAVISEEALAAAEALIPARRSSETTVEPAQLPAQASNKPSAWDAIRGRVSAIRKLADRMLEAGRRPQAQRRA